MTEYEKFEIMRDTEKNLVFEGEKVAFVSNKWINGQDQSRWNELTLYRTKGGKYVLKRKYVTCWQGESGSLEADIYDNVSDLVNTFGGGGSAFTVLEKELMEEAAVMDETIQAEITEAVD